MSDEGPESPGSDETGRKLSIVDAVCCVYFCAAGKSGLLVAILTGLGMEDERSAALANVARVRGMSVDLALSSRADLGEAVVIGHAKHLADSGHEVYVLIDDLGGQVLASGEGLGDRLRTMAQGGRVARIRRGSPNGDGGPGVARACVELTTASTSQIGRPRPMTAAWP